VQTSDLNTTLAALATDKTVEWFEANNTARQPAAKDDSGADPYCGATAAVPTTGTTSQEDSGADPYCTHVISNGAAEYADQWADVKINLGWAQKRTQGQGITIAVLDTQIETTHPALDKKLLPGLDLIALDPQTNVPTTGTKRGHGTFVAGVALHVAPAAKVLPVRVLNDDGRGSTSVVAEGIRQAAKSGAQVINLSLSTPTPSRALWEAVAYAQDRNAVLVAAYGNEGVRNPEVYPADFPNVLSVVATDDADVRAPFTNFGRKADVAAPGVAIVGPWRDGTYGVGSGTSYATPIVSGEVALLMAAGSVRRQSDAQPRIIAATDNIDRLNGMPMGFGRINLPAALLSR
jgi:thermitase